MQETRENTINLLKRAYESEEFGCQQGASSCVYYDADTSSCCAIGVLALNYGYMEPVEGKDICNIYYGDLFINALDNIRANEDKPDRMFGLSFNEARQLQRIHDHVLEGFEDEDILREYIYSL